MCSVDRLVGETWCFEHIENNMQIISTSIAAVTTVDRYLPLAYVCIVWLRHPIAQYHACVNRAIRCQFKSMCSACFRHRCCGTCSCDTRLRPSDHSFRLTKKLRLFIGVLSEASDMIHESCSAYVEHMYAQPSTIQCKSLYANYTCDSANLPCSSPFVVYRNCDTPVASKVHTTTNFQVLA